MGSESPDSQIISVQGIRLWGTEYDGTPTYPAFSYSVSISGFYINPDSGVPVNFSFSDSSSSHIGIYDTGYKTVYDYYGDDTVVDAPSHVGSLDGHLGIWYQHFTNGGQKSEFVFKQVDASIPQSVLDWQSDLSGSLSLSNILIPQNITQNISCSAAAVFTENFSNANFLCELPSAFHYVNGSSSGTLQNVSNPSFEFFNYWNIHSLDNYTSSYSQGLHIAAADSEHFIVMRSELHSEIFDFKSETERSKLS